MSKETGFIASLLDYVQIIPASAIVLQMSCDLCRDEKGKTKINKNVRMRDYCVRRPEKKHKPSQYR